MTTVIPQLAIISLQTLSDWQTSLFDETEAPKNRATLFDINFRMAKHANEKLTASTASSFFSILA